MIGKPIQKRDPWRETPVLLASEIIRNQGYVFKGKGKEYNGEKAEFLTDRYLLFFISFLTAVDFTVKP